MPELGSIVAGKYRVVREIGAGGMGTVVAAEHVQLGTPLALKFLSDKIKDSASSVERFTREARACAQLRSEHVCRVTDFGVDGGTPYLAMELLDGTDLSRLGGSLDIATAADYVLQACVGLAEAHALGIVHRDLKPHNLFLSRRPDGSPLVKVLDFGIAKFPVGDNHALTRTSHVVGSPGYMAPEQLRSSKTVDTRADVWALGVILYELVSGRHPFRAEAVTEIALKIAMDEPPPLTEAPALEAVVFKCLAKEPDERFQDVGALAAALAPFATTGAASATMVSRILGDPAEQRRTTPHLASPSREAETVREAPRLADTTQQHGTGVLAPKPAPKRRTKLYAGIAGVLVAGGIAAAAIGIGSRGDDVPVVAAIQPDAPAPTVPAPPLPIERPPEPAPSAVADAPIAAPPADAPEAAKPVRRTPQPGSGSPIRTGADSDAIRVEASGLRSQMASRGLLASDLGSAASDERSIATALERGDVATARATVDHWRAALVTIKIDRLFIQAKIARTQAAIRAARLADKVKLLDDLLAEVITAYGEADFQKANRKLNLIAAAIPRATKVTPYEDPKDKAAREKLAQEKVDLAKNSDILLARIQTGFAQPIEITTACWALINSDVTRVPWDRCVTAQCKINPSSTRTMIGFAPLEQQEGLRQTCPLK